MDSGASNLGARNERRCSHDSIVGVGCGLSGSARLMWEGVGEGRYDRRVPPVIEREEEAPPLLLGHRLGRPKGRTRGKASTWAGRRWARQAETREEREFSFYFSTVFSKPFSNSI